MKENNIKADFEEFPLPGAEPHDISAIIPTMSPTSKSRLGTHCYYFLNFKTLKGLSVRIRHQDIIMPFFGPLTEARHKNHGLLSQLRVLFGKYHYGFNFFEQIMLMTVPHTVTELGKGRFIISLWSYYGYIIVDCKNKSVSYHRLENNAGHHVFGSKQWFDKPAGALYYMTYSLENSLKKAEDPLEKVFSRVIRHDTATGERVEVWSGIFSDYMHDILLNKRYLAVCELGRFSDKNNNLIPCKTLVLDMQNKKEWIIASVPNAAHAQFDPDEPDIIYFSNHNFLFMHTPFRELIKKGSYTLKFLGPASVHKYRITDEGPGETASFTEPDMFRMTNFHVFRSGGKKILAAMGAPNFIFIADAGSMRSIRKMEIKNPGNECYIGTFAPSPDGNKLYIQTTRSFQIVNMADGKAEFIRHLEFNHTCSNHMELSNDTDW